MKIQTIAESTLEGGISVSAILDTRHLSKVNNATIAMKVGETIEFRTGTIYPKNTGAFRHPFRP